MYKRQSEDRALHAFQEANKIRPVKELRHYLIHYQLPYEDQWPIMQELGVEMCIRDRDDPHDACAFTVRVTPLQGHREPDASQPAFSQHALLSALTSRERDVAPVSYTHLPCSRGGRSPVSTTSGTRDDSASMTAG